jgi:fructose-specific phosphotransferase system IIA component
MKIIDILNESVVRTNLPGSSKEEVINAMIDLAGSQKQVVDKERMRTAILEREKIMSTGVGSGFAIPHGKTDAVSDIVAAFAVTAQPIDYQSLDDQPVRLVFLLVGRDNMVGPHIKLLSRISRLMNKEDFRKQLLEAEAPKEVLEIFRKEEETFSEG